MGEVSGRLAEAVSRGGYAVTVYRNGTAAIIPLREILAGTATVTAVLAAETSIADWESANIRFCLPWHQDFAGYGFGDVTALALDIAAALASVNMPAGRVAVHTLPVVDAMFEYVAVPVAEEDSAGEVPGE